jgi:hypothetical protein
MEGTGGQRHRGGPATLGRPLTASLAALCRAGSLVRHRRQLLEPTRSLHPSLPSATQGLVRSIDVSNFGVTSCHRWNPIGHIGAPSLHLAVQGLVRSIGVSNFGVAHLERLLAPGASRLVPAVNQIELSPFLQQREIVEFCRQRGIVLEVGAGPVL